MLQQVVLETANPMTLEIGNADPDEILILTSISGLSPADLTLFTGEFSQKGGYYQGRRANPRNPVFNFKINPDYANDIDASDARDILYRQFLEPSVDGDGVQIRLVDDRRPDRYLIGYTEKFPADIFVQSPNAQISMICTDPFLKSVDETFVFTSAGWLTVPITYDGSADTGIEFSIKVVANTEFITVNNNGSTIMLLQGSFLADDHVVINTNPGSRSIQLIRTGFPAEDIMVALSSSSTWLTLKQSANLLSVFGAAPGDGLVKVMDYRFRSEWWGI